LTEPFWTIEPRTTASGDTVAWPISIFQELYPASGGWTLIYYMSKGAEIPAQIIATPDGDAFTVSWTCNLPPGTYTWTARVSKGEVKRLVRSGTMRILPDPSVAFDRRSIAEICLEAINAVLGHRVGDPLMKYKIDGVEAEKLPPAELLKLRDRFTTEVRLQRGGSLIHHGRLR